MYVSIYKKKNMICRLCLSDLHKSFVPIFNKESKNVAELIVKYFQLEITKDDPVSAHICTECWRYLSEFENFYLLVAEKQQSLHFKTEPPEPADIIWNTETQLESKLSLASDIKDNILCEPEIDAALHSIDLQTSTNSHESEFQQADATLTAIAAAEQVNCKKRKGKVRLSKAKTIAKEHDKCKPASGLSECLTSMRESRARTRELRRNAAAIEITIPKPIENAKSETPCDNVDNATKGKRGRPKSVRPQRSKVEVGDKKEPVADLASKQRTTMKDLDDYIAANVKLDCCLCAAPLQNFTELKRHFRSAHNCTGYMQCCNNRYKKRTLYVDHLHYHKDPQYFSCKPCRKNFLNRNSQDMHMLRFHSQQQELVHQCLICGARFAKKFLLTMHAKGHKGTDRPEVCETCGKTFRTKLELTAHIKRMHTADFTPVICDICGVNFRSKANFLIHKKALHPEGPVTEVQCHLCGRWLRDERSLRKHLARHDDRDGNNKYRCKLCGVEKCSRVALGSHMRYHHSSIRHNCTLCGKQFKLPRALAEHMATHTGIDLYSCPFCTRTFKSHANMHNHKKKMHPNEWVRKYTQPSAVVNAAATQNNAPNEIDVTVEKVSEGADKVEDVPSSCDVTNLSACAS